MTRIACLAALLLCASVRSASAADGCVNAQVFQVPQGAVDRMRFEAQPGGVFMIQYDLGSSDPQAVYKVTLEVSVNGGTSFQETQSVEGDVGENIRPGFNHVLRWFPSRDGIVLVPLSQFRFNVHAIGGLAPRRTASLRIAEAPDGANVQMDGQPCGTTANVLTVDAGLHHLLLTKPGYVDTRMDVTLAVGEQRTLPVSMARIQLPPPLSPPPPPHKPAVCGVVCWSASAAAVGSYVWYTNEQSKATSAYDEYTAAQTLAAVESAREATLSARRNRDIALWTTAGAGAVAVVAIIRGIRGRSRAASVPAGTTTEWTVDAHPGSVAVGWAVRY